jgi:stage IV sporulation protein FB
MFGVPAPTEFDVRFRLLGIPVRVHPFFWLLALFLGWQNFSGIALVLWTACVFFSVLVHEFGHALVARRFGADPQVLLYGMGGLCIYQEEQKPTQRLAVLAMGPGAGFLLMAATMAVAYLAYGVSPIDAWRGDFFGGRSIPSTYIRMVMYFLILINFWWGIFNLVPIMPLDGGQIAGVLLSLHNRREGMRRAYIISVVAAGLLAIYFVQTQQMFNALLVGLLAFQSFQVLQVLHHQSRYGTSVEDDADWWKR